MIENEVHCSYVLNAVFFSRVVNAWEHDIRLVSLFDRTDVELFLDGKDRPILSFSVLVMPFWGFGVLGFRVSNFLK